MSLELTNYQVYPHDPNSGSVDVSGLETGQAAVIYGVTKLDHDPSLQQIGMKFGNGTTSLNLENITLPITLVGTAIEGDPPAPVGDFAVLSGAFVTLTNPAPAFEVELKDDGTLEYAIGYGGNFEHGGHKLIYIHPETKERREKVGNAPSGLFTWDDQAFNPRRNYAFELWLINEKGQVNHPPLTASHAPALRYSVVRRRAPSIQKRR